MKLNSSTVLVPLCYFAQVFTMAADEQVVPTPNAIRAKMPDKATERSAMKARYKAAKTWEERRSICIESIDKKIIQFGSELRPLVELFTTDGISPIITGDETGDGAFFVYFEEQPAFRKPGDNRQIDGSGGMVGWYLIANYSHGKIRSYCLTNMDKGPVPIIDDK